MPIQGPTLVEVIFGQSGPDRTVPGRKVVVRHNEFGEFEVPNAYVASKVASVYFADDKQDAIDTARYIWGADVVLSFRRGSHTPGVH